MKSFLLLPQEEVSQTVPKRGDDGPGGDEGGEIRAVAAARVHPGKGRIIARPRHEPVIGPGRLVEEVHDEHAGKEEGG